jgi:hypothetical protein
VSIPLPTRTAAPASATPPPVRTNATPMRSGSTTRNRIPNNRQPYLAWGTAGCLATAPSLSSAATTRWWPCPASCPPSSSPAV